MIPIKRNIFYRPMTINGVDIRFPGHVESDGITPVSELKVDPQGQHLGCFTGGMVAIASQIFSNKEEFALAEKLVEGCLWAYEVMPEGIMPEGLHTVPCDSEIDCPWNETRWHEAVDLAYEGEEPVAAKIYRHSLPPGVSKIDATHYNLRYVQVKNLLFSSICSDNQQPRGHRICIYLVAHHWR